MGGRETHPYSYSRTRGEARPRSERTLGESNSPQTPMVPRKPASIATPRYYSRTVPGALARHTLIHSSSSTDIFLLSQKISEKTTLRDKSLNTSDEAASKRDWRIQHGGGHGRQ